MIWRINEDFVVGDNPLTGTTNRLGESPLRILKLIRITTRFSRQAAMCSSQRTGMMCSYCLFPLIRRAAVLFFEVCPVPVLEDHKGYCYSCPSVIWLSLVRCICECAQWTVRDGLFCMSGLCSYSMSVLGFCPK